MSANSSAVPVLTGLAIGSRSPLLKAVGRSKGISHGGVPSIKSMLVNLGFPEAINCALSLLKVRRGYAESDHVLNIALNPLCGGQTLEDIELRRRDSHFLSSIDAISLPDPTTAADFCRRFSESDVHALMNAANEVRKNVWQTQPDSFFKIARIDADGVFVPTGSECAEGVDWSGHKSEWGYHPLVVSLANTQEPLFLLNRTGARPSYEGAAELFDKSIDLCLGAGFQQVIMRGDTDFSQTKYLDAWDARAKVKFVFGFAAMPNLVNIANGLDESAWKPLLRDQRRVDEDDERTRLHRHKDDVVVAREFRNLELESEDLAEFEYTPTACNNAYRMVVVRKNIRVSKGTELLFPEIRYFFYITNIRDFPAREIAREANNRCNQENLNSHLKSGVHALRVPLKNLVSNWAYMVMASLSWSFKAWFAMKMPVDKKSESEDRAIVKRILTMEFRTFVNNLMNIPALVSESGRRIVLRFVSDSPWIKHLLRAQTVLRQ